MSHTYKVKQFICFHLTEKKSIAKENGIKRLYVIRFWHFQSIMHSFKCQNLKLMSKQRLTLDLNFNGAYKPIRDKESQCFNENKNFSINKNFCCLRRKFVR